MSKEPQVPIKGKSAFDWDVYKNRRTALQYLKRHGTLVDTIIETEDGSAHELVHSQVISAFGDKLTQYIQKNGDYITRSDFKHGRLKLIRLPRVNRYTLNILIECAYTGYIRTDLSSGGIWQVLDMADYYEMTEVIRACCTFLIKNLNRSNCIYFYHIGIKHRHQLQRCAWHKIRANFKHILAQNLIRSSNDLIENGILGPNWSMCNMTTTLATKKTTVLASHKRIASGVYQVGNRLQSNNNNNNIDEPSQQQQRNPASQVDHSNASIDMETDDTSIVRNEVIDHNASYMQLPSLASNANALSAPLQEEENEQRQNNLATIKYEHFEPLLMHDKLNIDNEESVWYAIKLWCNYNLVERGSKVANLLPCMRFPRFRAGTEFSARHIWRDPLVINNKQAQQQLAILDRNHRDFLASPGQYSSFRDGFNLPCAINPRQLRPRVPHSILLAIGGWQQGQPTTLIESYDVNCNLWFESKRRIMAPLAYHGIEYANGLLYICGGTDGSEILNEMFTFDPIRGDCAQKPPMREARCYVSTACLNGHLYAMGGHNGFQRMKSVERFNLLDESWQHVQDMNVSRSDASACVHNSLIYIAGGLNDQAIESSVEFYNCQDNTWTFITSMLSQRTSFTLLAYQNSLLALGGNNGSERLDTVEQYNFGTKLWSHHSQMRHRRSTFSAALVEDSKLIVVGGYNGQTPFAQVEMYDGSTHAWTQLHKIRYDRSGLRVVVVSDLPNAAEYTFFGSQGASYVTGEELAPPPIGAGHAAAPAAGTGAGLARAPTTSGSAAPAPSLAARARRTGQIFLRQFRARSTTPEPAAPARHPNQDGRPPG